MSESLSGVSSKAIHDLVEKVVHLRMLVEATRDFPEEEIDRMTDPTHVYVSAADRVGMDLLRAELLRLAGWQQTGESHFLARERHLLALKAARDHLEIAALHAARDNAINDQALDLFAEELRLAQDRLNSITGEFTYDEFQVAGKT